MVGVEREYSGLSGRKTIERSTDQLLQTSNVDLIQRSAVRCLSCLCDAERSMEI